MAEKKLAEGFYFDRPREGAPEFVKGRLSVKAEQAIPFIEENKNDKGYINLDLLVSKEGKLYLSLNDWKPEAKKEAEYPSEDIDPTSVPF